MVLWLKHGTRSLKTWGEVLTPVKSIFAIDSQGISTLLVGSVPYLSQNSCEPSLGKSFRAILGL